MRAVVGAFMVLHGLVHLLYAGQALRLFALKPDLTWPDGSWAFGRILGDGPTRWLAAIVYVLVALGFAGGGIGILATQSWARALVGVSAAVSAVAIILLWDGQTQSLDDKGAIGLLISVAILAVVLARRLPQVGL